MTQLPADALPDWCSLVRADNPSPMTLDGTNTWVLATDDGAVVVDPGPPLEEHLRAVAARGPVVRTVLTHHHADHAEGAERFAELTGAPVVARDPELCRGGGVPLSADGALLDVAGLRTGLRIEVLHTPGHTADSICLLVEAPDGSRAVLTGDTILGRGSTVVAHPDGDLGAYLVTLRRLRDLGEVTVLPGHGPVLGSVRKIASAYLDHRERRLAQVRAALAAGDETAEQVVDRVYADVAASVRFAALWSVRAQLDYLAAN